MNYEEVPSDQVGLEAISANYSNSLVVQDLDGVVRLRLRETPTICLLHIQGDALSTEDPAIAAVTAANER